jgi:hypothetical protein
MKLIVYLGCLLISALSWTVAVWFTVKLVKLLW